MNNPDAIVNEGDAIRYCWAKYVEEPTLLNPNYAIVRGERELSAEYTNVTRNFVNWFRWGYGIGLTLLIGTCCCCVSMAVSMGLGGSQHAVLVGLAYVACCIGGVVSFGGLAWTITGSVLRWRVAGKICSGEGSVGLDTKGLLLSSGQFMNSWLIFSYVVSCLVVYMFACCVPYSVGRLSNEL